MLIWIIIGIPSAGLPGEPSAGFSLSEALSSAVEMSRRIQADSLLPEIADAEWKERKAIFIPRVDLSGSYDREDFDGDAVNGYLRTENLDSLVSLGQLNAYGGTGSINVESGTEKYRLGVPYPDIDQYTTSVYLKYTQPLLKGAGREITTIDIQKAEISRQYAERRKTALVNETVFDVFNRYFTSYFIEEQLRFIRDIREKTQQIHDIVEKKVELRILPVTDLNKMKTTLLSLDRQILNYENIRRRGLNDLIFAVYSDIGGRPPNGLSLTTAPDHVIGAFAEPDFEQTLILAKKTDLVLQNLELEREVVRKDLVTARNSLKSDLSLSVELGIAGYDGDHWEGSVDSLSADNLHTGLGLLYGFPVSNAGARSRALALARQLSRLDLQVGERQNETRKRVDQLLADLDSTRRQLALNDREVRLSQKNLDLEIQRLIAEKTTVLNVLDYQQALISAESARLGTQLTYTSLIGNYFFYRQEMDFFIRKNL